MNFGGLQEVVRGLAFCQRESGHSVAIACWTNSCNNRKGERELEAAGIRLIYLRRSSDGQLAFGRANLFRRLKRHLGAGNADVLHIHNPFHYCIYGAAAARAAGFTTVVTTLHATAMFDSKKFRKGARLAFWTAALLSHGVVSVCAEVRIKLRQNFLLPAQKLHVVENGIDLQRFAAVPARRERDEIVFGAVGRMSAEKNQEALIRAFARLYQRHRTVRLRLLGGGPLKKHLQVLVANLKLSEVVEFCGFSNDVPAFLGTLDVFVLPSLSEGMPLSLIEAIASGLPVVATAVGGVARIVKATDSGWICRPGDLAALSEAMEEALVAPGRRERGENGRRLVNEYYSAARMTRDYEQVYVQLGR